MFSTNPVKKFDIQEANKHLQLLHKRNAELLSQLDLKSGQLSKVEAQLEDLTKVKNSEVAKLSEQLNASQTKLNEQCKETEQWKMLVHERDVMISKLQLRCRQLEEMETRLYECRPSLEVLLGLIYNFDGTEVDSQTAAKARLEEVESEAGYAEPDDADSPDPPFHPSTSDLSTSHHRGGGSNQMIAADRVQHFLMNSVAEYEKIMNSNEGIPEPSLHEHVTQGDGLCNNAIKSSNTGIVSDPLALGKGDATANSNTNSGQVQITDLPEQNSSQTSLSLATDSVNEQSATEIFKYNTEFRVREKAYPVVKL